MPDHEWASDRNKAASRLAPQSGDGRFDVFVAMNGRRD
jgi:hypothetical protein